MASEDLVRPSRDGDQFHYYWAARLCLRLLPPHTDLVAISIEGPAIPDGELLGDGAKSIDVAEYRGSTDPATATHVRYVQLKHSSRREQTAWVASELTDPLQDFAKRYAALVEKFGADDVARRFSFEFVTNRPLAPSFEGGVVQLRADLTTANSKAAAHAMRLPIEQAMALAKILTLTGETERYLEQRSLLHDDVSGYLPEADRDAPLQMKNLVEQRATTEFEHRPEITRMDVLKALGADMRDLYPAPSLIELPLTIVPRIQLAALAERVVTGGSLAIIEADAGVGKSVLSTQLGAKPFSPPPAMDAPKADWDKFDADYDKMLSAPVVAYLKQVYPVDIVETRMGGVSVATITPKGGVKPGNEKRVLINVHGGGFFAGRGLLTGQMESIPIASLGGIKIVTVDYRMAPYFKYPAASEDSEAVYRELLKSYKPESIGIFGCSAGGTLTAQSIAWYRSKGLPRPGADGIFCMGLRDPRQGFNGDSTMWAPATGVPWQGALARAVAKTMANGGYMSSADFKDARAYPASSDEELSKFPPTLFVTGTRDTFMSSAITGHARLLKLGVDSELYIQELGNHGSILTFKQSPETRDTYTYIAKWFNEKLAN